MNRAQAHVHGEAHGNLVCQYGMSKQPITTLSGQRWVDTHERLGSVGEGSWFVAWKQCISGGGARRPDAPDNPAHYLNSLYLPHPTLPRPTQTAPLPHISAQVRSR